MVETLYKPGIYGFDSLRIGKVAFPAEVQVLRPEPISRDKPTAFVAGSAYEKYLGRGFDRTIHKAQDLGSVLGEIYTIITGHCPGAPSYAALAALQQSTGVIGLSPFGNSEEHLDNWVNSKIYSEIQFKLRPEESATIAIHTGVGHQHRDIFNVKVTNNHRQHVYVVEGNHGTYHEVTISIAEGAIIGALLGVGGVSDDMGSIKDYCDKHGFKYNIVEDTDPRALRERVMERDHMLKEEHPDEESLTTLPKSTPLINLLDTLESRILIAH